MASNNQSLPSFSQLHENPTAGRIESADVEVQTVTVTMQTGEVVAITLPKESLKTNQAFTVSTGRGEEVFVLGPSQMEAGNNPSSLNISGDGTASTPDIPTSSQGILPDVSNDRPADKTDTPQNAPSNPAPASVPEDNQTENFDDKIGTLVLYYCKSCIFHSTSRQDLYDHLRYDQCKTVNTKDSPNSILSLSAIKTIEHNYANADDNSQASIGLNVAPKTEMVSNENENKNVTHDSGDASMFTCPSCPYTIIHSQVELDEHQCCHEAAQSTDLFACHLCQVKSRRGRPMGTHGDWRKMVTHLTNIHKIDFQLACSICKIKFKTHSSFELHGFEHYMACQRLPCQFSSADSKDLDVHVKCHESGGSQSFRCFVCQFSHPQFPEDWTLMHDHIVGSHPGLFKPRHTCQKCGTGYQNTQQFESHTRECTRAKQPCKHCGKLMLKSELNEHISIHHEESTSQVSKNMTENSKSCEVAVVIHGNVKSSVVEHGIEEESVEKPEVKFMCLRHNMEFISKEALEEHQLSDHNRSVTRPKSYSDFVLMDRENESISAFGSELNTEESCTPQETNPTSQDPEYTPATDEGTLEQNFEMADANKELSSKVDPYNPVRCPHCYKKFSSGDRLKKHCARIHSAEKIQWVSCGKCNKSFRNKAQRRNHIREVHEGVKRKPPAKRTNVYHLCNYCNYLTPTKRRLINHQLAVHEGIMPYSCELCDYKTKERSDIRRHHMKHLGIKKHRCNLCSYSTGEHWILVNHALKMHGVNLPQVSRDTMGCALSLRWQAKYQKLEKELGEQAVQYVQVATGPGEDMETIVVPLAVNDSQLGLAQNPSLDNMMTVAKDGDYVLQESNDNSSVQAQPVLFQQPEPGTNTTHVRQAISEAGPSENASQENLMFLNDSEVNNAGTTTTYLLLKTEGTPDEQLENMQS